MNPLRDSSDGVPLQLNRQLDALCDEFESRLAGGELPPISEYLARVPAGGRQNLLRELAGMAAEALERRGVSDPLTELVTLNPELEADLQEAYDSGSNHGEATVEYEAPAPQRNLLTPRRKRSRGLHIRCPHCSNHVEVIGDTPSDEIDCSTCGSSFSLVDRSKQTAMAEALQRIDRFELVSRIGVGGFGTVWKARDVELDRAVAVKIPRHGQLTAEEMEQFFREARSVAQLRHPNIVPVHEVGREGDAVFIVSDLIRGVSLADMLTGKQLSPREASELVITVAEGLDHAHRRGVIHRDLKPSNIMIDEENTPFLMDFGLAKREAEEVTMTTDGQIVGTPAYMSPEQADGRSAWVDRRTDVYSLGVVFFELLTGELPFRGNAQMQVRSRLTDEAPNVRTLNRYLPIDAATICAKCLEREPGRRYQTAQEVADELKRYLRKEPIKARPLSPIGKVARWVERRPLHAFAGLAAGLLAVGGPTAAVLIEQQRSRAQRLADSYENLINARLAEQADARDANAALRERLDIAEGSIDSWGLWPPRRELPPTRQAVLSFLRARESELTTGAAGRDDGLTAEAMRLVALGVLQQEAKRDLSALESLSDAAEVLERLAEDQPNKVAFAMALADVCRRLSALEKDSARSEGWLEKAGSLHRSATNRRPRDAQQLAISLDTELRMIAQAGGAGAASHLESIATTQRRLAESWPRTPAELYRAACGLVGEPAYLLAEPDGP